MAYENFEAIKDSIERAKSKNTKTKSNDIAIIGALNCKYLWKELNNGDGIELPQDLKLYLGLDKPGEDHYFKAGIMAGLAVLQPENQAPVLTEDGYIHNFSQIIYYGVPGSGKSNEIEKMTSNVPDNQKLRIVFHPDYCNTDFVGQLLPVSKDKDVEYIFKPGPLAKILWRAYHNHSQKYYLIIEEINRGNAAAIFGEFFQLLDRKTKLDDASEYGIGWSKYSIENDNLNNYLLSDVEYEDEKYVEHHGKTSITFGKGISFSSKSGIRLPPNLSIFATMNTSDQNVFMLDNAFQRRWSMKLISNKLLKDSEQYNMNIHCLLNNMQVPWGAFRDGINNYLISQNLGLSTMEDCQLGAFFIHSDTYEIPAIDFAFKVLKYLWDDVFRMNREQAFKNTLSFESSVIDYINSNIILTDILSDDVCTSIVNQLSMDK